MATNKIRKHDVVDNFLEEIGAVANSLIQVTDLHEINTTCFFWYDTNCANIPWSGRGGLGFSIYRGEQWIDLFVLPYLSTDIYVAEKHQDTWSKWDTAKNKYLPITGGTLSANPLGLNGGYGLIESFDQFLALIARDIKNDNTNKRAVLIRTATGVADIKKALILQSIVNSAQTNYNIYGEHNKPTVTYTGSGSSEERYISIGGIGKMLCVRNSENKNLALVYDASAFILKQDGSVSHTTLAGWYESTGLYVLLTSNEALNKSGVTYTATLL